MDFADVHLVDLLLKAGLQQERLFDVEEQIVIGSKWYKEQQGCVRPIVLE